MNLLASTYGIKIVVYKLILALLFVCFSAGSMTKADERSLASLEARQMPDIEVMTVAKFVLPEGGEARPDAGPPGRTPHRGRNPHSGA